MPARNEQPLTSPDYDYRAVQHCHECGAPLIRMPILKCANCKRELHFLRSFVYRNREGQYIAECIDLNILGQGETAEEAIGALQGGVMGYLEVVLSGDPSGLILRKSPVGHRIRYHLQRLLARLRRKHDISHSDPTFTVSVPACC